MFAVEATQFRSQIRSNKLIHIELYSNILYSQHHSNPLIFSGFFVFVKRLPSQVVGTDQRKKRMIAFLFSAGNVPKTGTIPS